MDSTEVVERWANRSGAYSPSYYADYGPDETSELIYDVVDSFTNRDAAILELGCSSGRHLSQFSEHGYENLHGIEVNSEALDVMRDAYPTLATHGTFDIGAIETVVPEIDDGRFDVVYSVETLQHLHPDSEWVFEELVRITDDLLITVEHEGESDCDESRENTVSYIDDVPLYYRSWGDIFTNRGLVEIESKLMKRDTLRVFRSS